VYIYARTYTFLWRLLSQDWDAGADADADSKYYSKRNGTVIRADYLT
jgi:hypothetical protein